MKKRNRVVYITMMGESDIICRISHEQWSDLVAKKGFVRITGPLLFTHMIADQRGAVMIQFLNFKLDGQFRNFIDVNAAMVASIKELDESQPLYKEFVKATSGLHLAGKTPKMPPTHVPQTPVLEH